MSELLIVGCENEYNADVRLAPTQPGQKPGGWCQMDGNLASWLFGRSIQRQWPLFGARAYIDVGVHPEVASPECRDDELALYERADDLYICRALDELAEANPELQFRLIRNNNSEDANKSTGWHFSLCLPRRLSIQRIAGEMLPYFVVWQLLGGAGQVLPTANSYQYHMSQRAQHMHELVGSATTSFRPIINTRDEPWADADRFRRLHLVNGDSNMLFAATELKVRFTALLFKVLSQGGSFQLGGMSAALTAIKQISQSLDLRTDLRVGRRHFTPLSLLWRYYEVAGHTADANGWSGYDALLDQMAAVLQALENDDFDSLIGVLDWVTKAALIAERISRLDWDKLTPEQRYLQARAVDLAYHTIFSVKRVPGPRVEFDPPGLEELADKIIDQGLAPATTRAHLRELFSRQARARRLNYEVDWEHLRFTTDRKHHLRLPDPGAADHPKFGTFISQMG